MPLPQERFKVFISHAADEDEALVNWMADALDCLHIRAFVYERYPMGGTNRFELIKNMIETCPYFLVLLTRAGIASQWVNQEIGYAVGKDRAPIPIIEMDSATGEEIKRRGFIELHDPIPYYRNSDLQMMTHVVYTFWAWLLNAGKWQDSIFLSCMCGNDFEVDLQFNKHWSIWLRDPARNPIKIPWECDNCKRHIVLSFPDCHQLPQEG